MSAPPKPEEGVVSWNVGTACNYRCTYCTQRAKDDRGRFARDIPRFLEAFARLGLSGADGQTSRWEIKLSGGEPFTHPAWREIVRGLAAIGHRVSVVTNLSADDERIAAFVDAARGRVGTFSCSLHLEYEDDVRAFARRAAWLGRALAARADPSLPSPHVCVTTVATRAALARLPELVSVFAGEGVAFKVQPERQDGVVAEYTDEERALLLSLGGHNGTGAVVHDFFGRPCWAGARYFVLDDRGDAYRCYPARRTTLVTIGRRGIPDRERERRLGRLGNFLDPSFRLDEAPARCLQRHCTCTVPIARRMMAGAPGG